MMASSDTARLLKQSSGWGKSSPTLGAQKNHYFAPELGGSELANTGTGVNKTFTR